MKQNKLIWTAEEIAIYSDYQDGRLDKDKQFLDAEEVNRIIENKNNYIDTDVGFMLNVYKLKKELRLGK